MSGTDQSSSSTANVVETGYVLLSLASSAYAGFRGYGRGGFWGMFVWGLAGFAFPILTPAILVASGSRKRRK